MRSPLLVLLLLALGCAASNDAIAPQRIVFPHQWKGVFELPDFPEPSGAVYHPERETLFIVGDEGDIMELHRDGRVAHHVMLDEGRDLEGITFDPATDLLYVAVEGEERILEVDPDALAIRRTFTIERTYQDQLRMHPDDNGLEGIAFIPNPKHPEGGVFIVAHQSFTLDNPEEPSALMRVEAPLRTSRAAEAEARIVGMLEIPIIDMSGLHYDAERDLLYALSDAHNVVLTVNSSGQIIETRAFPGDEQEGMAVDGDDFIYIAQDTGGVLKVKWER
ncbi:MAG: SdiA-regulated domain-containing protein [Phycisphaeraceae bacterium]